MSMPFQAGQRLTAAELNALAPQSAVLATSQTVNSTSPAAVSGFSFAVTEDVTYLGYAWIVVDANSGGTGEFRWTGPASPSLLVMGIETQQTASNDVYQVATVSNSTGYNSGFLDSPSGSEAYSTAFYIVQLWITITPASSGTLALECANVEGGSDTFNLYPGSWATLTQVLS